ncbi:hypothetical protein A616_16900 [Brevibacillus brevis X23]|nr:hypothetical protein A616_16900 [Brevibacillus brevis X23]
MITINYCHEGNPYSDFEAEALTKLWFKNKQDCVYNVSTENIISYVRRMVAEGEIEDTDVQLQFNGQNLEMNEYAVIKDWKKGFCDYSEENAARTLKAQLKKRKEKNMPMYQVVKREDGYSTIIHETFDKTEAEKIHKEWWSENALAVAFSVDGLNCTIETKRETY